MAVLGATVTAAFASAAAPVRIAYRDHEVRTLAPVVSSPSGLLVPLRPVTWTLGGRMRWDEASRTAVAEFGGRRLAVSVIEHTMRLDGRPWGAMSPARTVQGQLLVPLAAVELLFGVHGRWLPQQRLLSFVPVRLQPTARSAGQGRGRTPGETTMTNRSAPAPDAALRLALNSDRASYKPGAPVTLRLTVTNPARVPVTVRFSSSQMYDFEVRRAGAGIWRWAADRMFTQVITSLTLGPGELKVFTQTWNQRDNSDQPVPAGTYEAIATLTTMNRPQPKAGPITVTIGG